MENFTSEMIEKAKSAKTVEELLEMAKGAEIELSAEDAQNYFEMLNPKSGELSDDELDNVAGGGCKSKKSGRVVVTCGCKCFTGCWESLYLDDKKQYEGWKRYDNLDLRRIWMLSTHEWNTCGICAHLEFEGGTGVCGKS